MNYSGKLSIKVKIYSHVNATGKSALYLQVFLTGYKVPKKIPLDLLVPAADFDKVKQRINQSFQFADDYNMIIEKALADINKIEISYRMSNQALTLEKLIDEYKRPSSRFNFVDFWAKEMEHQKEVLKPGTYRQQMTALTKLKNYKPVVFFNEITPEFLEKIRAHFVKVDKNEPTTVSSFVKNFKKYLRIASKRGIFVPIDVDEVRTGSFKGQRTFLMPDEINNLHRYYRNEFINPTHKAILGRFLFSCFTGLRISDNLALTEDNFVGDVLAFTSQKTGKFQRVPLNHSAKLYMDEHRVLLGIYTPEYINRELKFIAKAVGIRKTISFHVARHTFASNFLLSGGRVEVLQKILGHSKIEDTMIYVHTVEAINDVQIRNMDEILKIDAK